MRTSSSDMARVELVVEGRWGGVQGRVANRVRLDNAARIRRPRLRILILHVESSY